jgi:hypothetical protein
MLALSRVHFSYDSATLLPATKTAIAKAVAEELMWLGVPADRLTIVSYGKERPVAAGSDDASNARNRRVEFEMLRGDVRLVLDEGALYDDRGRPLGV